MVTHLPPNVTIPSSASDQKRQFEKAYTVLGEAIAEHGIPGAAFGVLARGQILALDGVGRFTYDPASPLVTASTVFDLASVTKVLATTSMAMLLYQRGQVQLDRSLVDILPEFAAGESAGGPRRQVTLRMLLAHASGLPGYVRLFETYREPQALLAAALQLPLEAAPGTRAEYSDPGFILLGKALEVLAGEGIEEFCRREVFAPLQMTSACFRPPAAWRSAIPPTEEDTTFRHRILQGEVQDENCFVLGGVAGHAGLFSNAMDALRYAQCVLNSELLFTTRTIQLFTTRAGMPVHSSRALGWDTPSPPSSSGRYFSAHSAGHLGYAGTSLWLDLERQVAIVLLTNRTWPDRQSQRIRTLRPAFHDAVYKGVASELGIPLW
jgi:serine-type D-Ala-D-Ala carboxypeptidase